MATLEHVGTAQFHSLLSTVPQHTVGADYPEEYELPTQAILSVESRRRRVQCPGPWFFHEGRTTAENKAHTHTTGEKKAHTRAHAPAEAQEDTQAYSNSGRIYELPTQAILTEESQRRRVQCPGPWFEQDGHTTAEKKAHTHTTAEKKAPTRAHAPAEAQEDVQAYSNSGRIVIQHPC